MASPRPLSIVGGRENPTPAVVPAAAPVLPARWSRRSPAAILWSMLATSPATAPPAHHRLLLSLRYVVPATVCGAGVVLLLVSGPGGYGPDALAALFGAGGAIYLMNKIMRIGIAGDADRDVEEAGRLFLDRYGVWPDAVPAGWRTPDGQQDRDAALAALVAQRRASDVAA
jgi:hypothetical protein